MHLANYPFYFFFILIAK